MKKNLKRKLYKFSIRNRFHKKNYPKYRINGVTQER